MIIQLAGACDDDVILHGAVGWCSGACDDDDDEVDDVIQQYSETYWRLWCAVLGHCWCLLCSMYC